MAAAEQACMGVPLLQVFANTDHIVGTHMVDSLVFKDRQTYTGGVSPNEWAWRF